MKRLTIIGNLGCDHELRNDEQGHPFAVFSVAIAVGTKASPKTDWIEVSCNGKLGEVAMLYAKKGAKVLVEGFPAVNAYLSKDNEPIAVQRLYARVLEVLTREQVKESSIDNQE